jgi:DNA-directed RNA polymerase specialized sigma24 family protein
MKTDAEIDRARAVIGEAEREDALTVEWLSVKEFAARFGMRENSVREAIRRRRLKYRVERLTTGPKGSIRILVPHVAA